MHLLGSKEERNTLFTAGHRSGDARFSACSSRAFNYVTLHHETNRIALNAEWSYGLKLAVSMKAIDF